MEDIWLLVVMQYLSLSEAAALKQTGKALAADCLWKKHTDKALLHLPAALPDTQSAALATLLIKRGADTWFNVNEKLHEADLLGKTALFQVLLDNEGYVHASDTLSAAAFGGHTDTVKLLLENVCGEDEDLRQARYWAAWNVIRSQLEPIQLLSHRTEILDLLCEEISDKVNAIEDVLDVACWAGRVRTVDLALAYAEKAGVNPSLGIPLVRACQTRRDGGLDIIREFLARGVDPDQTIHTPTSPSLWLSRDRELFDKQSDFVKCFAVW
ncbi:hypothetical protein HK104_001740 [Borealophlyctis nickersoniae]|nr:hypothetical protein HK104_001740 [Borealophlyctis nickersoniae]